MNWNVQPATEGQPSHQEGVGQPAQRSSAPSPPESSARPRQGISIGKTRVLTEENGQEREIEVFTMSLGGETIELLPLRNWGQLDTYKWGVRGKLPGTPAGLEISFDHVKMLGQTASTKEPEGCSKLEGLFNEWLALERENLELARKKDQPKHRPAAQDSSGPPEQRGARFRVEQDAQGQVHIRCLQGKEIVAEIGLNIPGFNGLSSQGLMRKPRKMQVGVLHNWVELDGELFSFEKGNNDAAKLEKALNGKYLPDAALGRGKDVVLFANAASSTGFDIQFPVTQGGVLENRRRPLNEDSLALLQDPNACGVLHKGLVIKLTRPSLVFKQKTPDGGERYLERSAEHTVTVTGDDGGQKVIDLSQPVNYLRLSPVELTAVFNHSAINRHSQAAPQAAEAAEGLRQAAPPQPAPEPGGTGPERRLEPAAGPEPPQPAHEPAGAGLHTAGPPGIPPSRGARGQRPPEPARQEAQAAPPSASPSKDAQEQAGYRGAAPAVQAKPLPNSWLEKVLAQPPIRHDWLACMVYSKIAERFGNSRDGRFGLSRCWAVALDETKDIADPAFKGIFLTEKHGLGFLCREQMARFNQGVAFIGTQESAIQGIGVSLLAVGFDVQQRMVLVVTDDYRKKFGVPDQTLAQELGRLETYGAVIMSVKELLHSQDPIEVLWTVPAAQENSNDPRITESIRPAGEGTD
jgi:hypothetical protein